MSELLKSKLGADEVAARATRTAERRLTVVVQGIDGAKFLKVPLKLILLCGAGRCRMSSLALRRLLFAIVMPSLLAVGDFATNGGTSSAQDLEPRAYANTPVGLNFLIGGYAYSQGTVGVDPSVPITDTEIKLNSAVLAYVRTLDLWGRSGKFDLILPYTWVDGSAKLAGQARTRKVSGFNDPRLRLSMLLNE